MTTLFSPQVVVLMGDSLSAGSVTGLTHAWSALVDTNPAIFPRLSLGNSAKSGDTSQLVQARYDANVRAQGFAGAVLMIGVNNFNVNNDSSAVAIASIDALVTEMLADGLKVLLCFEAGWSGYVNWSSGKQTNYMALRAWMSTRAGVSFIDFYPPFPVGLSDPQNPTAVYPPYSWGDGLHWNEAAGVVVAARIAAQLAVMFPAAAAAVTVNTFGVTYDSIRRHRFPHVLAFSTDSNPTATTVTEFISQRAAELEARLLTEGVSSQTITDPATSTYLWCQETVELAAAIRVLQSMSGQNPDIGKGWRTELDARYAALDAKGGVAIGIAAKEDQPEGPNSHISEYSLDIGDPTTEASDSINPFRKSDEL